MASETNEPEPGITPGVAHAGRATITEVDGEKVARMPIPKSFSGHSWAIDFFQNREGTVPAGPYTLDFVLGTEFLLHDQAPAAAAHHGYSYVSFGGKISTLSAIEVSYLHPHNSDQQKSARITPVSDGGRLCALRVELPETGIDVALHISEQVVYSILDVISLRHQVPAQVHHIDVCRDVGDDRFMRRYLTLPYQAAAISEDDLSVSASIPARLAPALRLYREAINSSNPHYRFLCLYRASEALEKIQAANGREISAAGRRPIRPERRLPDLEITRRYFPDLIGRKLRPFLEHVYHAYRNPIAHSIIDELDRLALDPAHARTNHRVDYTNAVMLSAIRVLIEDEWRLMSEHQSTGKV